MNGIAVMTLTALVSMAVIQDLSSMKIKNSLILIGLILGTIFRIWGEGISSLVSVIGNILFPILIFYLLFLARIIGAGDIKLFSVIGSFICFKDLARCMLYAFLIGAVLSFCLLVVRKNFFFKIKRVLIYFARVYRGERISYQEMGVDKSSIMHFSVAIGLGLFVVLARNCLVNG